MVLVTKLWDTWTYHVVRMSDQSILPYTHSEECYSHQEWNKFHHLSKERKGTEANKNICLVEHSYYLYTSHMHLTKITSYYATQKSKYILLIDFKFNLSERFPIECRKTKTKVITLAYRNWCKQHIEPIRIRSKYM